MNWSARFVKISNKLGLNMVNDNLTHTPDSSAVMRACLICVSFLMLNSAVMAQAQSSAQSRAQTGMQARTQTEIQVTTPCDSLDDILYSAALIQKMTLPTEDDAFVNMARELDGLARSISLPALIAGSGAVPSRAFETERAALFQYLSSVREGAAAAQAGFDNYALDILAGAQTPDFTQSLSSLQSHWMCGQESLASERLAAAEDQDIFQPQARFGGGALADTDERFARLENTAVGTNKVARRFSGGGSTLPSAQLDSVMPKASVGLFLLLLSTALIIGAFYARVQSRKSRVREQRRVLNSPVAIRVGTATHDAGLVDISMNGLKLEHSGLIKRPSKLYIQLGETWHPGQIKWHNKLYAGVKFKKPIDAQTLSAVISAQER